MRAWWIVYGACGDTAEQWLMYLDRPDTTIEGFLRELAASGVYMGGSELMYERPNDHGVVDEATIACMGENMTFIVHAHNELCSISVFREGEYRVHCDLELFRDDLPPQCIADCTQQGMDASDDVTFWRNELNFTVNRENAERCLYGYGAWEKDEIDAWDEYEIAERILWLACGSFNDGEDCFVME